VHIVTYIWHQVNNMPNVIDQELFDLLATRIIPVVETIPVAGMKQKQSSS